MDSQMDFFARTIRYSKGGKEESERENVFMGMYLLVLHYRIVCRKTFVINKWYTCIRDYRRYIPRHMSSALPALPRSLRSSKLRPRSSYGNHANSLTHTGKPSTTCLAQFRLQRDTLCVSRSTSVPLNYFMRKFRINCQSGFLVS